MKTFGLLLGVFAITMAAVIAGHYANKKQSGMFPPGNDNPATRSRQAQVATWRQAAQNGLAPLQRGQTTTLPQARASFGQHVQPAGQETSPMKRQSITVGAPPNLEDAGETALGAERASRAVRTAHKAARRATSEGKSSGAPGN